MDAVVRTQLEQLQPSRRRFSQLASGVYYSLPVSSPAIPSVAALRPLLLLLKSALAQRRLHETFHGGVGSYLLFLMAREVVHSGGGSATPTKNRNRNPELENSGALLIRFLDAYHSRCVFFS